MKVQLNGEPREIECSTLSEIVALLELDQAVVATAVNGRFVPKGARAETRLSNGDQIEVLAPMQGG